MPGGEKVESYYWKADLLKYAMKFKPVLKPLYRTVRRQENFEKDVAISFFIVRKLIESSKLSSKTTNQKVKMFRSPCVKKVNNRNFWDIEKLYDLQKEEIVNKSVVFVCNQFIHGGAMF